MRWKIGFVVLLLAAGSGWLFLRPASTPAPPSAPTPQMLAAQSVVRRSAAAGDLHRYTFALAAGDFVALDVQQQGVDVALRLFAPSGRLLSTVDSPNGERGMERLQTLAVEAGLHTLEIFAAGPSGAYLLSVEGPRPASAEDLDRAAADTAYSEAEALRQRGDRTLPAALAAYHHTLDLARRSGDLRLQALALRRMGQVAESLEKPGEALAAYTSSLDLYRRCGDLWEQALLSYALGRVHRLAGDQGAALEAYRTALLRFAELGDRSRQGSALNALGLIHAEQGSLQDAIDCYGGALTLWRQIEAPRFEAATLKNLGDAYASLRYNERAARLFRQALALYRATEDEPAEAWVLESLGTVQRRMGAFEAALASFDRSLILMRRHDDSSGEAIVLNSQGATHFQLGHSGRARALYGRALELARRIGEPGTEAYVRINLGWLEETQGSPDRAVDHHQAALRTFRTAGDLRGESSALFGLARAERRRGRLAVAQARAQESLTRIELLRHGVANDEIRSAFLADRHSYYELLVDILMEREERQPGEGFAARALQISEWGRARVLLDLLRSGRADLASGAAPDLLAREREIVAALRAAELERPVSEATVVALTEELHDVRGRIRAQHRSRAASNLAEAPTLREIRSHLDAGTLLLEISLGDERSFLWLVGRDSFLHRELPGRRDLEAQARRAHRLLARSHVPLYRKQLELVLRDLGRTLLGPIAGDLAAERLVIVADGALQLIPFAVLPCPAARADPPPLIERHQIVQLPSIAVLATLRKREAARPRAPKTLAVFGDPVFAAGDSGTALRRPGRPTEEDAAETGFSSDWFRSLPSSRQEAEAILALVPPEQRLGALGHDAQVDRILDGELRSFRILHFATHGLLNHDHPDLSGIALSRIRADGSAREAILWAHQIYGLELPAELVVLSACQTALGREMRGEGMIGLTGSFLHAGATRVLVSLWEVDDKATAELMTRFYRALLRERLPPGAALRAAQLSLRADPRWSSPSFWSGFVLQGDWT